MWSPRRALFLLAGLFVLTYLGAAGSIHRKISIIKSAYAEIYYSNSAGPLLRPDMYGQYLLQQPQLADVRILTNGVLEIPGSLLVGGRYYLTPRPDSSGRLEWNCTTKEMWWLRYVYPDCFYDTTYRPDLPVVADIYRNHALYFEFNKADAEGLDSQTLEKLATFTASLSTPLVREIVKVEITAYADPIGSHKNNIRVSNARAAFVREFMIERGVPRNRVLERVMGPDDKYEKGCEHLETREEQVRCFQWARRVDVVAVYRGEI